MLLVPTYLRRSPIHGLGVFTPVAIPAGTVIWEFDPELDWRLTEEALERFPEPFRARFRVWCYREEDSGLHVLCGDNARFMNHSFTPNCDDAGACTIAVRDIAAGEELTCDYRSFDADSARERFDFVPAARLVLAG